LLFPPITKVVFAADGTGEIKERLDPVTATRAIKRKRARKISDNLIQYKQIWSHEKPLVLTDKEIILLGTISNYTKKSGWLKADKRIVDNIFQHNERVIRLAMPGLESIPLGAPNPVKDIKLVYKNSPTVPLVK